MIGHGVPGLNIHQSFEYSSSPKAVFAALTEGLNAWWPTSWRQTGPDATLVLNAWLGAAMTETGAADAGAIWGWIDAIIPDKQLHLLGHFGVENAVAGRVQFDIDPNEEGCTLQVLHQAIGPVAEDRGAKYRIAWRDALDTRLRAYLQGATARD